MQMAKSFFLLTALSLLNVSNTNPISNSLAYSSLFFICPIHRHVGIPAVLSFEQFWGFFFLSSLLWSVFFQMFCFSFYQTVSQLWFSYRPTHMVSRFSVSPPTLCASFFPFPVFSIYRVKSTPNWARSLSLSLSVSRELIRFICKLLTTLTQSLHRKRWAYKSSGTYCECVYEVACAAETLLGGVH